MGSEHKPTSDVFVTADQTHSRTRRRLSTGAHGDVEDLLGVGLGVLLLVPGPRVRRLRLEPPLALPRERVGVLLRELARDEAEGLQLGPQLGPLLRPLPVLGVGLVVPRQLRDAGERLVRVRG